MIHEMPQMQNESSKKYKVIKNEKYDDAVYFNIQNIDTLRSRHMYKPEPINTEDIVLSEELLQLTEVISENVHNVWAAARIEEGWTYGDYRDERKKVTPCLVPYDQLPEEEKAYDRHTAMETIKLLVKLGYDIVKK